MVKTVIIDSDAIFALYNPHDALNPLATKTFEQLVAKGYQLIYPTSVLFEIITLFQRVLPTPTVTLQLVKIIKQEKIIIYSVDPTILREAAILFDPAGNKKNTLTDCSVVAIAKKTKADGVFAYDNFYKKQGLQSAEDILKSQ